MNGWMPKNAVAVLRGAPKITSGVIEMVATPAARDWRNERRSIWEVPFVVRCRKVHTSHATRKSISPGVENVSGIWVF